MDALAAGGDRGGSTSLSLAVAVALVLFALPRQHAFADSTGDAEPKSSAAPTDGAAPALDLANMAHWKLEQLHLKNGRVLPGLVKGEDDSGVDFLEIRQPADRPMYFVMFWRFPIDKIDHVTRLSEAERKLLTARVDAVKNRSREEEEGQAKIVLTRTGSDGNRVWHYGSETWRLPNREPWLVLDSTADEETTRRSIVRIEQMFAAYREVLPPRSRPVRPLEIQLFGTMREYRGFLKTLNLNVENPAVFIADENRLAVGSELSAYAQQMQMVRRQIEQLRADYEFRTKALPSQLTVLRQQLSAGGAPTTEQRAIIQASQSRWKNEIDQLNQQINAAERHNLAEFDRVTVGIFARLFHEAFHAYLENYVFPQRDHDVPRWLNEGLAQIFETGQLEAGTLRLDAPHAERLAKLQGNLRSDRPLSLADVLKAKGSEFLVFHTGGPAATERSKQYYLYSWGLAYYLAFRQPVLETAALDRYVEAAAAKSDPIARFERLVGMPLDQFESRWRAEMLRLK